MKLNQHQFLIVIAIMVLIFGWQNANCLSPTENSYRLSLQEVSDPLASIRANLVQNQTQAAPSVDIFDFNDGTLQGWTVVGPGDEDGNGPFPSHFTHSWADVVNYPAAPLADPLGDNHGSYKICNVSGHGITNPGATWWVLYYISPNLSGSATWQNATGYSFKLLNYMEKVAPAPGDHLTLYLNMHLTVFDPNQNKERYFSGFTYAEPISNWYAEPGWIDGYIDWSAIEASIPGYSLVDIYLSIWGSMSDYFEGGVYLDDVIPTVGSAKKPIIKIQPTAFNETVQQGTTKKALLKISNTGDADLTFSVKAVSALGLSAQQNPELHAAVHSGQATSSFASKTDSKGTLISQTVSDVLITGWGNLNPGSALDALKDQIQSLGYRVTMSRTFPGTVDDYEMIVLVGGGSADETIPESMVDNFVSRGKGLIIFEGVVESGDFSTSAASNPVQSFSDWRMGNGAKVVDPTSELCTALTGPFGFQGWSTIPILKSGAKVAIEWNDGRAMAATYRLGSGKVVYLNDLNAWYADEYWRGDGSNGRKLLENALNFVAGNEVPWLSFSDVAGTVAPGASFNLDVIFDATSLVPDTYHAGIVIQSNDPVNGRHELAVAMNVTPGATPIIGVQPTMLDFSANTNNLTFNITNSGSGSLNWSVVPKTSIPWLKSIVPENGTGNAIVTVSVDRANLIGDNDTGVLSVNSNGGNREVELRIAKQQLLPTNWRFTENTGNSATVVIPVAANPAFDGAPLDNGDYIGIFTPAGLCCGWQKWLGANLSLTVWGDDNQTPATDGFQTGEALNFRLFHNASSSEHMAEVAFEAGHPQTYQVNGFSVLTRFRVRTSTAVNDAEPGHQITEFQLGQNYPNPFNPQTQIAYSIAHSSPVQLKIFNLQGQFICTLVNREQEAGSYEVEWDARDDSGQPVPNGVYLYQLNAGKLILNRKMILLK